MGAPEDQVLNASAPRKIDGEGTIALIEAAEAAGVSQFVLVTSLGTGKIGWPASTTGVLKDAILHSHTCTIITSLHPH